MPRFLILLVLFSLTFFAASLSVAQLRATQIIAAAYSEPIALGLDRTPPKALPFSTTRQVARICLETFEVGRRALLPPRMGAHAAGHCAAFVAHAKMSFSNDGALHLIEAQLALYEGQSKAAEQALIISFTHAPYEGWLSQKRFAELAQLTRDYPDGPWKTLLKREAAALLHSQSGAELVARYYVQRKELRVAMAEVLDHSPRDLHERFFNQVRVQSAERNL